MPRRYSKQRNKGRLHLCATRKRPGPKKGYWKNRLAAGRQSQPEADGDNVAPTFREYQEPYPTSNPSNTSVTVKQEIVTVDTPEHSDLTFSSLQNMLYESCPNFSSTAIKVEPPNDHPVLDPTLPLISDVRTDPYTSNNLRDTPSTSASVTLPLISDVRTGPYSNNMRYTPSTSASVTLPLISDVRPVASTNREDISTVSASGTLDDMDTFIPSTVVDCQLGADDSPTTDDINSNGLPIFGLPTSSLTRLADLPTDGPSTSAILDLLRSFVAKSTELPTDVQSTSTPAKPSHLQSSSGTILHRCDADRSISATSSTESSTSIATQTPSELIGISTELRRSVATQTRAKRPPTIEELEKRPFDGFGRFVAERLNRLDVKRAMSLQTIFGNLLYKVTMGEPIPRF